MLDFDLRDTAAGQDIFEMGIIKGTFKGALKEARKSVIDILAARFENVPSEIEESVNSIGEYDRLAELRQYAACSHNLESFREILSEITPASNAENMAETQ